MSQPRKNAGAMSGALLLSDSLPPRDIFPATMPRYPNLWFLVDRKLALRGQYPYALRFLVGLLEGRLALRDTFVQDVENHGLLHMLSEPGEGSDFQARIGPLHRYEDSRSPARSHWHQLHARFYVSPLTAAGRERQEVLVDGQRTEVFLVPACAHYEVATDDPLHPYEDSCPVCGITGEYAFPLDRASEDYCIRIHDPLGIEFLLHGTVRSERVKWPDGRPVACLSDLSSSHRLQIRERIRKDTEPLRTGEVLFLAS